MAPRVITRKLYQLLVEGYREKHGNHSHAGRYAGCDRRMAKRAWAQGWLNRPWANPIREVLEEDTRQARAKRKELVEQEYADIEDRLLAARKDAVDTRAQEGKLVLASRQSALGLIGYTMKLLKGARPLVDRLVSELEKQNRVVDVNPLVAMRLLKDVSRFSAESVSVCQEAMRLERMHMGEPETVVGVIDFREVSDEDLLIELREVEAALRSTNANQLKSISDGKNGSKVMEKGVEDDSDRAAAVRGETV